MSYIQQPGGSGSGGITSINGDTTAAQLIVGGTDISVATLAGTTTISFTGSAGGVTSLNSLTGALTIAQTTTGTDFTVSTSGGNTVNLNLPVASATNTGKLSSTDWSTFNNKQSTVSFGTFGSTPNSAGGGISGGVITLQPANGTNPGGVSTTTQTFAGDKTFTGVVALTDGAVGTPGVIFGTDTTTGWYRSAANAWTFAQSGVKSFSLETNSWFLYDTANITRNVQFQIVSSTVSSFILNGTLSTLRAASDDATATALSIQNTDTGGSNWELWSVGSNGLGHGTQARGAFALRNTGGTGEFAIKISPKDRILLAPLAVSPYGRIAQVSSGGFNYTGITGTTTINASTTLTGSSTVFLNDLGIMDRVSVSSAATVFSQVQSVSSNTAAVLQDPIGDGTSQTINVQRAIHTFLDASGNFVAGISPLGRMHVGPIDGPTFFTNDAQKALTTDTITSLGTDVANIIKILNTTVADIAPSADTSTSPIGFVIYAGQGSNANLTGSNKFDGGIPVGGLTWPSSVIGAFGQCNIDCSNDVDGVIGTLFTSGHRGNGAAADYAVGACFAIETGFDFGTTGSLENAIAGAFVCKVASDGADSGVGITNAYSGVFYEPYSDAGGNAITNRQALRVEGTWGAIRQDSTSTGTINALVPSTSYIKFDAATTITLNGITRGIDGKRLLIHNKTGNNLTINHQSGSASAADQISTATAGAIVVADEKHADLVYDSEESKWILLYPEA